MHGLAFVCFNYLLVAFKVSLKETLNEETSFVTWRLLPAHHCSAKKEEFVKGQ